MTDKTPNRICKNCGHLESEHHEIQDLHGYVPPWTECYHIEKIRGVEYSCNCSKFEPQDNNSPTEQTKPNTSVLQEEGANTFKEDEIATRLREDKTAPADIPLTDEEILKRLKSDKIGNRKRQLESQDPSDFGDKQILKAISLTRKSDEIKFKNILNRVHIDLDMSALKAHWEKGIKPQIEEELKKQEEEQ